MAKFTAHHREELEWYYRESRGALGLSSSLGAMINMAMSGISQGGRAVTQSTPASMSRNSAAERQRHVAEVLGSLSDRHQSVLRGMYGDHRPVVRRGDSPKEAGEWASVLTPAERLFGELAHVVTSSLDVDCTCLLADRHATYKPSKGQTKAEAVEASQAVACRVADAKRLVERTKRQAVALVRQAEEAYAKASKELPPRKARNSLRAYEAWIAGGVGQ